MFLHLITLQSYIHNTQMGTKIVTDDSNVLKLCVVNLSVKRRRYHVIRPLERHTHTQIHQRLIEYSLRSVPQNEHVVKFALFKSIKSILAYYQANTAANPPGFMHAPSITPFLNSQNRRAVARQQR